MELGRLMTRRLCEDVTVTHVRSCCSNDFDAVVTLLRQLWPGKPINREELLAVYDSALASTQYVYLCATEQDRVVGFGSLTIKNNLWQEGYLAHIDELIVDAGCRGRGIGTRLLQDLILAARERGCRRVELDPAFHREDAHRFYEQHGFENRAYLFSRTL